MSLENVVGITATQRADVFFLLDAMNKQLSIREVHRRHSHKPRFSNWEKTRVAVSAIRALPLQTVSDFISRTRTDTRVSDVTSDTQFSAERATDDPDAIGEETHVQSVDVHPIRVLDKKHGEDFHWRDANKVIKSMQALKESASRSNETAFIDFSAQESPIMVLPISDWHFGSFGSDYAAIEEFTDAILSTPNLYVCVVGDMLQMSIKMRSVLELSDNALTPELQMRYLESWLEEIEKRVLFSTWDNHSVMREEKVTGFSRYADIFKRKVVYFNGIGHPSIQVGKQTYRIAVSHRFRGYSYLNPLHAQMRYMRMEAPDREIVIQGDTHLPAMAQYCEAGECRTVINCGSFQTNSGYAKRFFSLKTWTVFPCFALYPDKHKVLPFWNLADMAEVIS